MNRNTAIALVLAVLLGAAGYITYTNYQAAQDEPIKDQFAWSFIDRGVDAERSMPQTLVKLAIAGVDVEVGTFDGNCFVVEESQWTLLSDELTGAICYFAGGGTEIGVFKEGDTLVLKKGVVEEGDAENPGFRGNFEVLERQPS